MLTREMRYGWAQVGDRVEERFTLGNTSWVPALWVEIVDHSSLPGYQASRVTGIDGHSESQWSIWSVCNRRGAYILGPTTLRSGDPFGVYSVTLEFPVSTTMLVLPPVVPLPDIQIAPGGRAGEGRRRGASGEVDIALPCGVALLHCRDRLDGNLRVSRKPKETPSGTARSDQDKACAHR